VAPATQDQWQEVMGRSPPGQFRGKRIPVEGLSWLDSQEFLTALGERASQRFRLPSEAEWEYACRGLTSSPFWFGEQATTREANFDGNYPYGGAARSEWRQSTSPVGTYPANLWGLFDTHGNVWEWCQDWYEENYYQHAPPVDPTGPDEGELRVLRGGSWYSYSWSCRSAGRERFDPRSGNGNHGFRVVADHLPND
ncbi:MAG: formylglycine-generating enzyme family protein, partial [Gemmataceae bacterium]